jgi:hypothetical protein
MHPHRMVDRGSAKHLWATTGVSTHRQEHETRQLPFMAGRWLLALFASGLGSSVRAPSRNLEISKSRARSILLLRPPPPLLFLGVSGGWWLVVVGGGGVWGCKERD